jgi:hypothetical protein
MSRVAPAIVLLLLLMCGTVGTIKCPIGYGQRGLQHSNKIEWPRQCPLSSYCWEATTRERQDAARLFSFHWGDYYDQYFVRGCGGEFGTHPTVPPDSVLNVSVLPVDVKGKGGTAKMRLSYSCSKDMCSSATRTLAGAHHLLVVAVISMSYIVLT